MIQRAKRTRASHLLREFRDGVLTNDEFEGAWPSDPEGDRALPAIGTMIWRYYSDIDTHRLVPPHALLEKDRELFDRAILFLKTEMEYEWPQDSFDITPAGERGLLDLVTGGWFHRRAQRQFEEFEDGFREAGDTSVWPFRTRDQLNNAMMEVETPVQ